MRVGAVIAGAALVTGVGIGVGHAVTARVDAPLATVIEDPVAVEAPTAPVPEGAAVEIAAEDTGQSQELEFDPDRRIFTVAVDCASSDANATFSIDDATTSGVDLATIPCTGAPMSAVYLGDGAPETIRISADQGATWDAAVYEGKPSEMAVTVE